jgi:hypothetical protein
LRGLTPEFGSFNDQRFDESRFEHNLQSDPRLALPECWYWIRKLQARVYANDYASALDAASKAQKLLWTSPSFFEMAEYHFYGALGRHSTTRRQSASGISIWRRSPPTTSNSRCGLRIAPRISPTVQRW